MAGLRPFRQIPTTLVEWTRWMRDQETSGSVSSSTTTVSADGTTTTTTTTASYWTIEDFSGNYTLRDGDEISKLLRSTSGSATNVTVPAGVFTKGSQITVMQHGAGAVTIVAATGVTIRTPTTLLVNEQYGTITLILMDDTTDEWVIAGRLTP